MSIFKLTEDQQKALDKIEEFLNRKNPLDSKRKPLVLEFRIKGGAGVGKSFLTKQIVELIKHKKLGLTLVAPTHKAKHILENFINVDIEKFNNSEASLEALEELEILKGITLAQALDQIPVVDNIEGKQEFLSVNAKKYELQEVIIIDEASMISKEDLNDLHNKIRSMELKCKIIYILDEKQLPPIGFTTPPVNELPIEEVILSKPMRFYADSNIGKVSTLIRQKDSTLSTMTDWSRFASYCSSTSDINIFVNQELWLNKALVHMKELDWINNPNSMRIISGLNDRVDKWNEFVSLNYFDNASGDYLSNELLISKAPLMQFIDNVTGRYSIEPLDIFDAKKGERTIMIDNGTEFTLKELISTNTFSIENIIPHFIKLLLLKYKYLDGDKSTKEKSQAKEIKTLEKLKDIEYQTWCIKLEGESFFEINLVAPQCIKSFSSILNKIAKLTKELPEGERSKGWKFMYSLKESFHECKRASSITVHNSQGSSFKHTYLDFSFLNVHNFNSINRALVYTALTRASDSVSILLPTNKVISYLRGQQQSHLAYRGAPVAA